MTKTLVVTLAERPVMDASILRFRTAMRFSLWAWALYWPGGGLMLIAGGGNPALVAITLLSLGSFIALVAFGGLKADASRNRLEFFIERPLYFVVLLVGLIIFAQIFTALENVGLALFATANLLGMALLAWRAKEVTRLHGEGPVAAKTDQTFIVLGLTSISAILIFVDAWLPLFGAEAVGGTSTTVALANWASLLYPALLMVATRPLRDPLQWPRRNRVPVESALDADAAAEA